MDVTNLNLNITGVTSATLDSDGNGTLNAASKPPLNNLNGGTYCFLASGTFGSGRTLTLQQKVGESFVDVGDDAILTAPGGCVFTTSQSEIQLVISGGSGDSSDNLYVAISPVN